MATTTPELAKVPWHPDGDTGRHLYAQLGKEPSPADVLIAAFTHPALCAHAADTHNQALPGAVGAAAR